MQATMTEQPPVNWLMLLKWPWKPTPRALIDTIIVSIDTYGSEGNSSRNDSRHSFWTVHFRFCKICPQENSNIQSIIQSFAVARRAAWLSSRTLMEEEGSSPVVFCSCNRPLLHHPLSPPYLPLSYTRLVLKGFQIRGLAKSNPLPVFIHKDWLAHSHAPTLAYHLQLQQQDWVVVTEILWSTKPKNKLLSGPWQGLLTPALCTYSLASGQSCQPMEDSCHPPWISHVDGRCLHFPSRYLSPGINCSESSGCPSFSSESPYTWQLTPVNTTYARVPRLKSQRCHSLTLWQWKTCQHLQSSALEL